MKFRNLLLTAALVLSASVAFAGQKMKGGQAKNILKELTLTSLDSYSWTAADPVITTNEDGSKEITKSVLNITMVRMNGNEKKVDTGWRYSVGGYASSDDNLWTKTTSTQLSDSIAQKLDKPAYNAALYTSLTQDQIDALDFYAKNHSGFSFEVDFDKSFEEFGLIGDNKESIANMGDANKFYSISGTDLLYYGSTQNYPNNGAFFLVSVGSKTVPYIEEVKPNGQPLPAPIATLLIALGFGAAFVMYRNRKQVKA